MAWAWDQTGLTKADDEWRAAVAWSFLADSQSPERAHEEKCFLIAESTQILFEEVESAKQQKGSDECRYRRRFVLE